jgi:putative FmdB family regulatory protein
MPLYDFHCQACQHRFEQIARGPDDPEGGVCPKCDQKGAERQVSRFRVGGRGDLRETTEYHGCHSALDVGHDHGSAGHVHSSSCGHGSNGE